MLKPKPASCAMCGASLPNGMDLGCGAKSGLSAGMRSNVVRVFFWKLSFQGKALFSGSRFLAYRQMYLNHLVHHRAQLGVYLRLNGKPVPSIYGPSADETLGF